MAQLYTLLGGKSKSKITRRIMTNTLKKCESYKKDLEHTARSSPNNCGFKWFALREAVEGEQEYIRSNSSKWTGYNRSGVPTTKQRNPKN